MYTVYVHELSFQKGSSKQLVDQKHFFSVFLTKTYILYKINVLKKVKLQIMWQCFVEATTSFPFSIFVYIVTVIFWLVCVLIIFDQESMGNILRTALLAVKKTLLEISGAPLLGVIV